MEAHTRDDLRTFDEFKAFFTPKNPDKPEIHGGFVRAAWCEDPETLPLLEELKVTIRCKPLEQRGGTGKCILTGKPATNEYIFAKSY
jgi:prolyl-tRNA synthetase